MAVHRELGPGYQERFYYDAMIIALGEENFKFETEKEIKVFFRDNNIGNFRLDLCIENKIVVELKAVVGDMPKVFQTQVISYLKASDIEIGLLINFGNESLDVKRLARYKNYKY